MGAANISSGMFQGITIDMSLSSTASGEAAGERTQLSSLVSAGVILAVVLFLAPLLKNLPSAVLGAIVLSSILGLFNVAELKRYYAQRKTDFALAITALVGVISTDVMTGLMIAVLLSLVMLLYRASRPYIAVLGKRPDAPGQYIDVSRHAGCGVCPGPGDLAAGCAAVFLQCQCGAYADPRRAPKSDPPPQAILLDLGASADLDIGTSDMLQALISDLRDAKIDLLFAQVRGSVRDRMRLTGLLEHIGEENIYMTVDAAVRAFESRPRQETALPERIEPPVV